MSDLPPQTVNPHHTERARRRHRFWVRLGVGVLCLVVIAVGVGWLTVPPPGPGSPEVAVSLPSGPSASANLPTLAPVAGSQAGSDTQTQTGIAPENSSGTQTAMLPPRPE